MSAFGSRPRSDGTSEPAIDKGDLVALTPDEAIRLGVNSDFFCRTFFPRTFRQASPSIHEKVWRDLEDPTARYVLNVMFRGSAKTTLLRAFSAKRIAYQLSNVALWIGANEGSAARSVGWLRRQIEWNAAFRDTFGLEPGRKWGETELEIRNRHSDHTTWVKGVGMDASFRGINFDDYRPDLIVLDDVIDDENALTEEGRTKTTERILGAVARSLISEVEKPNAKLAMLQTPLHIEDATSRAAQSASWRTNFYPCWTPETADLDVAEQQSCWPEMFPSDTLRVDKLNAIKDGTLHVFLREMECKLIAPGTAAFVPGQLQFWENPAEGLGGTTMIAIDPVPPPSDREVAKNMHNKNYEAISVVSRKGGKYFLLHYELMRGHDPGWTISKIFELSYRFNCVNVSVEAIAYQRTLKWLLTQEMSRRQRWLVLLEDPDASRLSKFHKIVDTIRPLLNNGKLLVGRHHTEFISSITQYPQVQYDDLLDSVAQGLRQLTNPMMELGAGEYRELDEDRFEELDPFAYQGAP